MTALVLEVTDDKSLPKAERKQLQVEKTPYKSDRAKLLKLAEAAYEAEERRARLDKLREGGPPDAA